MKVEDEHQDERQKDERLELAWHMPIPKRSIDPNLLGKAFEERKKEK
jgi:hypothetical protein